MQHSTLSFNNSSHPETIHSNRISTIAYSTPQPGIQQSGNQHHIRTQQFQELLTKMDTIQRQSIDQSLRKLAETAGFSDIYAQD